MTLKHSGETWILRTSKTIRKHLRCTLFIFFKKNSAIIYNVILVLVPSFFHVKGLSLFLGIKSLISTISISKAFPILEVNGRDGATVLFG